MAVILSLQAACRWLIAVSSLLAKITLPQKPANWTHLKHLCPVRPQKIGKVTATPENYKLCISNQAGCHFRQFSLYFSGKANGGFLEGRGSCNIKDSSSNPGVAIASKASNSSENSLAITDFFAKRTQLANGTRIS